MGRHVWGAGWVWEEGGGAGQGTAGLSTHARGAGWKQRMRAGLAQIQHLWVRSAEQLISFAQKTHKALCALPLLYPAVALPVVLGHGAGQRSTAGDGRGAAGSCA